MQRHARHVRLDVGDFDMIVGLARALRARRNIGAAMLAGRGEQIAPARGIWMQPPVRAGMGLARAFAGGAFRRLLSARGRRAGIIRRPWRQAQPGLKLGHPRRQNLDLPGQGRDRRRLRGNRFRLSQDQPDQRFLVERPKDLTIHPKLESAPARLVKIPPRPEKRHAQNAGGEELPGRHTYILVASNPHL